MSEIDRQRPGPAELFAEQIDAIEPAVPWALAVSGGSDSLALMHLACDWTQQSGGPAPIVLTVDHGLRDGSAREAIRVQGFAHELGLQHHSLTWKAPKPTGDLQSAARDARYRLMGDFCRARDIGSLLLAHTQDDQAETFLLRLARGSGLDGLSGMVPSARLPLQDDSYGAIRLIRPLLKISRESLRSFLRSKGQTWIEDPSNSDENFARVQMRNFMPDLSAHGLSAQRLAETAERLLADRRFIEDQTSELARACVRANAAGYMLLDAKALLSAPATLALRVLGDVFMGVGGGRYRPRAANLARLYRSLVEDDLDECRTLAGCHIEPLAGSRRYLVSREWRALSARLARDSEAIRIRPGQQVRWDHRLDLALTCADAGGETMGFEGEIRPLGPDGWRTLKDLCKDQGWTLPQVPARARAALPGLWVGNELVSAVPLDKVRAIHAAKRPFSDLRFEGRFAPDIQGFLGTV